MNAYAKINWVLNVLDTRPDGYHEMDMLMQRISLCDALSIEPAQGIVFDGRDDNLVVRAARALDAHAGGGHGARIQLTKRIPSRAGLGGGSADAAATLIALNERWQLHMPMNDLLGIGLALGADVPFCLMANGLMRARGIGEDLSLLGAVPSHELVILHPGCGLSTPAMFRAWDEEPLHTPPADIEAAACALQHGDFDALNGCARNMLHACAARALPEIDDALGVLRDAGAAFAAMSGSGSAVFGVFHTAQDADAAAAHIGPDAIRAQTIA